MKNPISAPQKVCFNYQFCRSNIELNLLFGARLVCSTSFLSIPKGLVGRGDLKLNSISKTHIPPNPSRTFRWKSNQLSSFFYRNTKKLRMAFVVQRNRVHISIVSVLFPPFFRQLIRTGVESPLSITLVDWFFIYLKASFLSLLISQKTPRDISDWNVTDRYSAEMQKSMSRPKIDYRGDAGLIMR